MKKSFNFILLVFSLLLAKSSFGLCEKITAINAVNYAGCGNIQFKYNVETGNGAIKFEWIVDNKILMDKNDFTLKFTGKRYIPYTVHIWNDCSDYKNEDSIYIDYELVSVMAAYQLQNCTEAKFHFISSDQRHLPKHYEWSGDDGLSAVNEWEPTHTYSGPGTYNYTLKYLADGACEYSYFQGIVTIKNTAYAEAGDDKTICMYNGQQVLSGIPVGGMWTGNGVDGNIFDPEKAGVGTHELLYTTHENQCIANDKITIVVKDIDPDFSADVLEGVAPFTVNFSSKLQSNQFVSWNFGDLSSQSLNYSSIPSPSHTYSEHGEYNITLNVDDNETGCSAQKVYKKMIKVSEKNAPVVHIYGHGLEIYANPTPGEFKFVLDNPDNINYSIDILSIDGKLLTSSGNLYLPTTNMNLSEYASGLYLVKVNMNNGKTLTGKIVISK